MPAYLRQAFNTVSSLMDISLIVLTIPLAFDVGGENCGIVSNR